MAGLYATVRNTSTALVANTSQVIASVTAPSSPDCRLRINSVILGMSGTGAADPPVLVEMGVGSASSGSALTPVKRFSTDDETLLTTSLWKATGTLSSVLFQDTQHIQTSRTYQFPAGTPNEMICPAGTIWLVRLTPGSGVTGSVTGYVQVNFEE